MKKRKHHYVWKHHLRAWGDGEQIWCKHEDRLFFTSVENVAQQRDFYKLRELSEADLEFVREFIISQSPPGVRERHGYWTDLFTAVQKRKKYAAARGVVDPDLDKLIDELEYNLEEDLHGSIERAGMPLLDQMRNGDIDFYYDDEMCMLLMYFLSTQYFRTNPMKQRMAGASSKFGVPSMQTTWNIMAHVQAANLGGSLYRDRKKFSPTILNVSGTGRLITGDQPLINSHHTAGGMKAAKPTHFDLYFPLSPNRAFLLREVRDGVKNCTLLDDADVSIYNNRIASNSFAQLYAASNDDLVDYRASGITPSLGD